MRLKFNVKNVEGYSYEKMGKVHMFDADNSDNSTFVIYSENKKNVKKFFDLYELNNCQSVIKKYSNIEFLHFDYFDTQNFYLELEKEFIIVSYDGGGSVEINMSVFDVIAQEISRQVLKY